MLWTQNEINMYTQYNSPFFKAGKGCAKSEGGSGCIVKRGGKIL
jgi:hypothetical protein